MRLEGVEPPRALAQCDLNTSCLPVPPLRLVQRTCTKVKKDVAEAASFLGAGDEVRTRDLDLGKVALYQLSYSRLRSTAAGAF